jgi:hypothetical protein
LQQTFNLGEMMARKKQQVLDARPIITTYYEDFQAKKLVKKTYSVHANTASKNCFHHMQMNHYGAVIAEIFDGRTGTLHDVIKRKINGEVRSIPQREIKEGDYV